MSDADKTLEILIKTKADLAAALDVQKTLEKQIFQAKLLGKSSEEQQRQLQSVTREIGKYTEAVPEAAEQVEHFHASHRALHKVMHEIGAVTAPELGHALGSMLYGPIGLVLALGAGFEFLARKLEEAGAGQAAFVNAKYEGLEEALKTLISGAQSFDDAIRKAGEVADPIKTEFEQQNKLLEAQVKIQDELVDKQKERELAAAGENEVAKRAIAERYAALNKSSHEDAENRKQSRTVEELGKREEDQARLDKAAEDARKRLASFKGSDAVATEQGQLKVTSGEQYEKAILDIDKAGGRKTVERRVPLLTEEKLNEFGANAKTDEQVGELTQRTIEAAFLPAALDLVQRHEVAAKNVALLEAEKSRLEEQVRTAAEKAKSNQEAITKGQLDVGVSGKIDTQTGAQKALDFGRQLADRGLSGENLGAQNEQFLRALASTINGHSTTLKTAEQMLHDMAGNMNIQNQFQEKVVKMLERLQSPYQFMDRIDALQKKLDDLEKRQRDQLNR